MYNPLTMRDTAREAKAGGVMTSYCVICGKYTPHDDGPFFRCVYYSRHEEIWESIYGTPWDRSTFKGAQVARKRRGFVEFLKRLIMRVAA